MTTKTTITTTTTTFLSCDSIEINLVAIVIRISILLDEFQILLPRVFHFHHGLSLPGTEDCDGLPDPSLLHPGSPHHQHAGGRPVLAEVLGGYFNHLPTGACLGQLELPPLLHHDEGVVVVVVFAAWTCKW